MYTANNISNQCETTEPDCHRYDSNDGASDDVGAISVGRKRPMTTTARTITAPLFFIPAPPPPPLPGPGI